MKGLTLAEYHNPAALGSQWWTTNS